MEAKIKKEYLGPYNCLIKNSGVCSEIADTFQLLCQINNIDCSNVYCNIFDLGKFITEHQFNKIQLADGKYTFCDVTAEINKGRWQAASALKKPKYDCFCRNAEYFKGKGYSTETLYCQYYYYDDIGKRVDIPAVNRSYRYDILENYTDKKVLYEIKHTKGDFELPNKSLKFERIKIK